LTPRDMTSKEIKEEVIYKLFRRGSWGSRYSNRKAVEHQIDNLVKDDGKKVSGAIDELAKDFLVLEHKKRKAISLNPRRKKSIMKIIDDAFSS